MPIIVDKLIDGFAWLTNLNFATADVQALRINWTKNGGYCLKPHRHFSDWNSNSYTTLMIEAIKIANFCSTLPLSSL